MSLGLAPLVLDNPAELAIVRDGETGLVAHSIEECTFLLQKLVASTSLRRRLSANAVRDIAATRNPERSAQAFLNLWFGLCEEPARRAAFNAAIGETPAAWFLATQDATRRDESPMQDARASKGSLAHFASAFPGDSSLADLVVDNRGAAPA